ncbi:MAG: hypothetical protein GY856_19215 [bacterium]|nr:hypothetical protein [bacterium]
MLPNLMVFGNEPGVAKLLADAAIPSWFSVLADLDSPELYRLTLDWATGDAPPAFGYQAREGAAVGLSWNKILAELRSRAMFAALPQALANPSWAESGRINIKGKFHEIEVPLCGVGASATTLRLPQSNHRHSSGGAGLLCRDLAITRLTAAAGSDESFDSALSIWARSLVSGSLEVFEPTEGIAPIIERLARYFTRSFTRSFTRDFTRSFTRDFGRDFTRYFARDLARCFARDFTRDFIHYFIRDLARYFTRDSARDFTRDSARDFTRDLLQSVNVEPDAPNWEAQCRKALKSDDNVLKLIADDRLWWSVYELSKVITNKETRPEGLVARLDNPFAMVLLLANIWIAASVNQIFALGRHLAATFPDGLATTGAMEAWLRRNPLDVYGAALAWEEHAKAYRATHDRLEGSQGALLLAHAAYAALMTGFSFDGPVWTALVDDRDPNDPLIEISYLLHEICHSRASEQHARRLCELVAAAPPACREVLDAAGIVA